MIVAYKYGPWQDFDGFVFLYNTTKIATKFFDLHMHLMRFTTVLMLF